MVDTSFIENAIFPVDVSRGTAGGPDWPAEIVELASGREERNTRWSAALRYYDAKYGVRTQDQLYQILSLYYVALGRMRGFRLLDLSDYRSGAPLSDPAATDQALGTGDGATTQFQLAKSYSFAGQNYTRTISKPYGTILIAADGVGMGSGFTVDTTTGVVTFSVAPSVGVALTWGGQFHVPVRFDCKLDQISLGDTKRLGELPSILLKELRL